MELERQFARKDIIDADDIVENAKNIGAGCFAKVYVGFHKKLNHRVAIKRFSYDKEIDRHDAEKIKAEFDAMMTVRHGSNIVTLYGVIVDESKEMELSLVMEYMTNKSLRNFQQKLKNFNIPFPWNIRKDIVNKIIAGMSFLHANHIIHRDLKLDNVLVGKNLEIKIADFGFSVIKTYYAGSKDQDKDKLTGGTLSHIAPEALIDLEHDPNEKDDVYSFGIMIWEYLTGDICYKGARNNDHLWISVVHGKTRPKLSSIPDDCPKELRYIPPRCWENEPQNRPFFQDLGKEMLKYENNPIFHVNVEEERVDILKKLRDIEDVNEEDDFSGLYKQIQHKVDADLHDVAKYEQMFVRTNSPGGKRMENVHCDEPDDQFARNKGHADNKLAVGEKISQYSKAGDNIHSEEATPHRRNIQAGFESSFSVVPKRDVAKDTSELLDRLEVSKNYDLSFNQSSLAGGMRDKTKPPLENVSEFENYDEESVSEYSIAPTPHYTKLKEIEDKPYQHFRRDAGLPNEMRPPLPPVPPPGDRPSFHSLRQSRMVKGEQASPNVKLCHHTTTMCLSLEHELSFGQQGKKQIFKNPHGVATHGQDYLVCDTGNARIVMCDQYGRVLKHFNKKGGTFAKSFEPYDIVTTADFFVVTDPSINSLHVFTYEGIILRTLRDKRLKFPWGVAFDSEKRLIVAYHETCTVAVYTVLGQLVKIIGSKGTGNVQFMSPTYLEVNSTDNILVSDAGNRRIQIITSEGQFLRFIKDIVATGLVLIDNLEILCGNGEEGGILICHSNGTTENVLIKGPYKSIRPQGITMMPNQRLALVDVCSKECKVHVYKQRFDAAYSEIYETVQ